MSSGGTRRCVLALAVAACATPPRPQPDPPSCAGFHPTPQPLLVCAGGAHVTADGECALDANDAAPSCAPVASDGDRAERDEARQLFASGVARQKAGDAVAACASFTAAARVYAAPPVVAAVAWCAERRHDVALAIGCYRELALFAPPPSAPPLWASIKIEAARKLAQLMPGSATLALVGAPEANATFALDGYVVAARSLGAGVAVNPGRHRVVAVAAGGRSGAVEVTIAAGERAEVALRLAP